jgi:hypothetical protein
LRRPKKVPQRLKPRCEERACGTAEAVPLSKTVLSANYVAMRKSHNDIGKCSHAQKATKTLANVAMRKAPKRLADEAMRKATKRLAKITQRKNNRRSLDPALTMMP